MNWFKRGLLVVLSVVLFMTGTVSAFAAGSPSHRDTITMTTQDGTKVTLYKMPDNIDMLKPSTRELYQAMIDMAKMGTITLYMGEYTENGQDCVLVQTFFPQRAAIMDDKNRTDMDTAYAETQQAEGKLDQLNPDIKNQAEAAGVSVEDCRVNDIFDLTFYRKKDVWRKADDHGKLNITVGTDRLKNFVSLQHRNNGKWETVKDAKVTGAAKDTLTFSATELSPFAIVTWGDAGTGTAAKQSPKTGDNTLAYAGTAAVLVIMLAGAAFVLIAAAKKRRQ